MFLKPLKLLLLRKLILIVLSCVKNKLPQNDKVSVIKCVIAKMIHFSAS